MKKLTLILAFILTVIILPYKADAQWYKSYNANHPGELTEAQLVLSLRKAEKITRAGYTFGTIGGLTAVFGGLVYTSSMVEIENAHYFDIKFYSDRAMTGAYLMAGGIGLLGIAVPLLITGYSRKAEIQIALAGQPASIAIRPDFSFNSNNITSGLKISLNF